VCYKQKCKVVSLNLAHPVGQVTPQSLEYDWTYLQNYLS